MNGRTYTIGEIAILEGVNRRTIGDLCRTNKIPTPRHPLAPTAKAIDEAGYAKLRQLLNRPDLVQAS